MQSSLIGRFDSVVYHANSEQEQVDGVGLDMLDIKQLLSAHLLWNIKVNCWVFIFSHFNVIECIILFINGE